MYSKSAKNSFTLFNNVNLDIFEFVDFVAIKMENTQSWLASNLKIDLNEEIQLKKLMLL